MKTKILSSLFVLFALISVGFFYVASTEADPSAERRINETQPLYMFCESFTTNDNKLFFLRKSFALCQKPYAYDKSINDDVYGLMFGDDKYLYFKNFFGALNKANIKVTKFDFQHSGTGYLGHVKFSFKLEKNGVEKSIIFYMNTVKCENLWYLHFDMENPGESIKRKFDKIMYLMVTAFDKKVSITNDMMNFMLMLDGTKESAVKATEKYRVSEKIELDGLDELPIAEAKVIESKDGVYIVDFTIAFDTLVRYKIFWENGKITSAKKIER